MAARINQLTHSIASDFGLMSSLPNEVLNKIIQLAVTHLIFKDLSEFLMDCGINENVFHSSVIVLRSLSLTNKTFAILTAKALKKAHADHDNWKEIIPRLVRLSENSSLFL